MAIGKEVASYLEAHLLSIFLVFHLLRGQMGLSYFFFLVWAESRKITKLGLVCFGTMGCSKII